MSNGDDFNPDEFMKSRQQPAKEFDPDEYMAGKQTATAVAPEEQKDTEGIGDYLTRKGKEYAGQSTWEKVKSAINPLSGVGVPSELLGAFGNTLENQSQKAQMEDLRKGTQREGIDRYVNPASAYDLTARTAHAAGGAISPENIALGAGLAVAPATVGPALAMHGGYNAYEPVKKWLETVGHEPEGALPLTGNLTPEEVAQGAGSLGEMTGGLAATGAAVRGGLKNTTEAKALRGAQDIVAGDPNVAAQRAMGIGPKSHKAIKAQTDIAGSRPYLEGAEDLADLQKKTTQGKTEVWKPYKEVIDGPVGDKEIMGPDGLTTVRNLEAKRLELSADRQKLRRMLPTDRASALQKDADLRANEAHYHAITGALDPELRAAGIDPVQIRNTHGNLTGVQKLIEGRNTLSEADRAYGIGRAIEDFHVTKPLRSIAKGVIPGLQDILSGRPWYSGKPTDVNVAEGFRPGTGGAKPSLTIANPPPAPPSPTLEDLGQPAVNTERMLPAPATEMPYRMEDISGPMSREERQGSRWVTPIAQLPERTGATIPPIETPKPTPAPIVAEKPTAAPPPAPPEVVRPVQMENLKPEPETPPVEAEIKGITAPSKPKAPPKIKPVPIEKKYTRSQIQDAEGLVEQEVGALQSSDQPGRYFDESEAGDIRTGSKQIRGGDWRAVTSGRPMMEFFKDHPDITPEQARIALRNKDSAAYRKVIDAAMETIARINADRVRRGDMEVLGHAGMEPSEATEAETAFPFGANEPEETPTVTPAGKIHKAEMEDLTKTKKKERPKAK